MNDFAHARAPPPNSIARGARGLRALARAPLATNLSATTRERWIGLAADYRARVRIAYVEVPLATLLARNRARPERTRVPERVILGLLDKWEVPELSEAHAVERYFG